MLVYVRHGHTALNQGGSEERLRGWLPTPLDDEGIAQAHRAGLRFRGLEPNTFESSDLPRSQQTAQIMAAYVGHSPQSNPSIRDWNTGDYAGQKVTDVLPTLQYLVAHPDQAAPNGESINTYLSRFVPVMRQKIEDNDVHLVVGHARGAMVLQGLAAPGGGVGGDVDKAFLHKRPDVEPGGALIIQPTWKTKIINPETDGERSA